MSRATFKEEAAAPGTPPSGYVVFYAKTDGLLYFKDDTGTEYAVKGGAALTDFDTLAKLNGIVTDATLVDEADIVLVAATSLAAAGFFLDEDNMASDDATKVASQQSIKAYVDAEIASAVAGGVTYKGTYDASTNTPDLDTSPSGVVKGDMYIVSVAGTFFTVALEIGDALIAEVDSASAEADWSIIQGNIDYTAAEIKTLYESNADTNAYDDAAAAIVAAALVDGDFSKSDGFLMKTGAGAYDSVKMNFASAVAPGATDDSSAGYALGSIWIDSSKDKAYICVEAGVGVAVWNLMGESGPLNNWAAGAAPAVDDDALDNYDVGSFWADGTNNKVYVCTDPAAGAAVWVELGSGGGGGGMTVTPVKTANYTASANEVVPVDSTGGGFTVTLPASPSAQERVIIIDVGKDCTANPVFVGRNSKTIDGVAEDFEIDQDHGRFDASYDGTSDWDAHLIGTPALVNVDDYIIGRQTRDFWMRRDMYLGASQNPSAEVYAGGTNGRITGRDFDPSSVEYVFFEWVVPDDFDESWGFAFIPIWTPTTTGAGDVVFELRATPLPEGAAIDTNPTANGNYSIDSSLLTVNDVQHGPEATNNSAIGLSKGESVLFRYQRYSSAGSDTLASDARILGIRLIWKTDQVNEDIA